MSVIVVSEWSTSAVGRQFQSSNWQSSSVFDVSSLPWSQLKSVSPELFAAGDDSLLYKPGQFLHSFQFTIVFILPLYMFIVLDV